MHTVYLKEQKLLVWQMWDGILKKHSWGANVFGRADVSLIVSVVKANPVLFMSHSDCVSMTMAVWNTLTLVTAFASHSWHVTSSVQNLVFFCRKFQVLSWMAHCVSGFYRRLKSMVPSFCGNTRHIFFSLQNVTYK